MDQAGTGANEYIDTHTHFLDAGEPEARQLVERARSAGVSRMLAPAVDLANCRTVLAVAEAFPEVFAAVGIHPNDARADDDFSVLEGLARHPRVRAIGETGLDYYRQHTTPELQRAHLDAHMRLAGATGLPVILHNRMADEEIYAVASNFRSSVRGVLHCFSGDLSLAARFLELGYYLSFAGNLTYGRSEGLRDVARQIPSDRLLVETDSPYLSPVPLRGKSNEPANVIHTVQALAGARNERVEDLACILAANARALFGL